MKLPTAIAKKLLGDMPEPDRAGIIDVFHNPMLFVLSGVLIGMTLVDSIRENVRAKQFDAMLEEKLQGTVDELAQLRADRDHRMQITS